MSPRVRVSRGRRHRRPRVLLCTPEITELPAGMGNAANYVNAKGGGMGDISAALIGYLHKEDRFDLHVAMPRYSTRIRQAAKLSYHEVDLLARGLHRRGIHLVADSAFSRLNDPYGDEWGAPSRIHRALAFQRYVVNQLLDELQPEIVHCNDWMTGLIPPAVAERGLKSLFTLHNVFTELETPLAIDRSGIDPRRLLHWLYFERFPENTPENWSTNRVDFTASGIHGATAVNTVSPTFLREILDGEFQEIIPPSVRHALREKDNTGMAFGILNSPGDAADPRISPYIRPYDIPDVAEGKRANKSDFQERLDLTPDADAPLLFWPSRLFAQKGPSLLFAVAARAVTGLGCQIAVVANGDSATERAIDALARRYPGRVARAAFDQELSELGKAAADFVLMPSRYEPCGLPQMESPRFGTLPVVRSTGGLRDTIEELSVEADRGNGFVFDAFDADAFLGAIRRAVDFYRLPVDRRTPQLQRIMRDSFERFSLARTAASYIELYDRMLGAATPNGSAEPTQ